MLKKANVDINVRNKSSPPPLLETNLCGKYRILNCISPHWKLSWNKPECLNILALIIPQAFIQAAELSVPSKQVKDINYKIVKSENVLKAEIEAKKASKKGALNGKP